MLKTQRTVSILALTVTWFGAAAALAQHQHGQHDQHDQHDQPAKQEKKGAKLPLCPVMGESVDFNVKTATDDGPVYFCCEGCIKKYEKAPEKYAKKTETQRAALKKMERVQVTCPVSGSPVDGKTLAMIEGQGVSFCCADCVGKYEQNPKKYRAALEASYSYQTRCPVMGGKIDPKSFTDLSTGERVYFCCAGCEGKLLAHPEKYAPKLAAQGVNIDVVKVKGKSKRAKGEHDHP